MYRILHLPRASRSPPLAFPCCALRQDDYCPRRAFTLIELLVVMAILVSLFGVFVPAVQRARETAAAVQCQNHLKQLVLGLHHADNVMASMPPATGYWPTNENWNNPNAPGYYLGSPPVVLAPALVHLYPYVEQSNRWSAISEANSFFSFWLQSESSPSLFLCPSDPTATSADPRASWGMPLTSYAANAASLGCYGWTFNPVTDTFTRHYRASLAAGFPDGTSNTIVFYDRLAQPNGYINGLLWCWAPSPPDGGAPILGYKTWMLHLPPQAGLSPSVVDSYRANSGHINVVQVGLADGSVRSVSINISPATWHYAQTPNDGKVLGPDW
jgi:prepilin-type N-terminal cleavage/methylation domain-containing protein